jgi:hypothetical protein
VARTGDGLCGEHLDERRRAVVTTAARIAFALLVGATFAAFFFAQELKSTPPLVQDVKVTPFFSPNRDGRFDRAHASFVLKRADDVTVTVIDRAGDVVRELADNRHLARGRRMAIVWDGRAADGRLVSDGIYRIRASLRRQGRSVTLPRNIRKDTRPPDIVVTSIGPMRDKVPRPELLPNAKGEPARVSFRAPGRHKEVLVYRTDVRPVRPVFAAPVQLPDDATRWTWDGTVGGRRVAPGTYLVVIRARDQAGNIGSSAPIPPRFAFREPLRGRGGITVRYLTAQAPSTPVTAGDQASVAVDSVDQSFTWTLRRAGYRGFRKRGRGTRSRVVHFPAPGGKSGLYIFEARTRTHRTAAPLVVQSRQASDVLVVLPVTTWQATNPVDDDGDGRPNTLDAGLPVDIARPYAGDGLPAQLTTQDALLLAQLDRGHRRYDVTTDVALARGAGPRLDGHRGVILAGDARWLDPRVARALRSFVRGGGRLLSVGTGSLRRSVTLDARDRAVSPTLPTERDLFGARLRPVVREPVSLVNVVDGIDLFGGTEGLFAGVDAFEQTLDVRGGARAIAAAAATQPGDRQVIVASRFGDGLVIRPGMPDFSAKLRTNPELATFLSRAWTLLRRR